MNQKKKKKKKAYRIYSILFHHSMLGRLKEDNLSSLISWVIVSYTILRAVSNGLHLPALSELGHDVDDEILDLQLMLLWDEILGCGKCVLHVV